MRFLILGCNGMAGHTISLYLKEKGHDVFGFDRSPSKFINSVAGDAMEESFIKELIGYNKYDTVINCIGLLNQFAENNKSSAVYLNSYFPHQLAELTADTDTQIIHMSTDCVFSGERGQYTEEDLRDGRTFYDRTKALGELEDNKNITLRNSIVGPDINPNGIGLLNWFMQQNGDVTGYTGAMWTGQTTLQLAKTMEVAAQERAYGLFNTVPESSISKCDLLVLFNKYIRKNKVNIIPVDRMAADKSLKRTRWDFSYKIPDYEFMVAELAEWMRAHKELYPHYEL
ncbi:dTDP-4-dehydrorhamnose reductase [Eubacterium ruminantium]|uniref:dTDP-4-dehydrorhamnose reductase n=1 Tax=Eubacterium ruminantium TaxID=42322 RepID=A0A1T4LS28_9FIRM|nr:sugar nucleotide-binding protein [Eubacterium ruminantium]SCW40076.1 dTDP-4-dehydrorhamnose reductase [Eubacterium ruminantium]SDM40478.1 dTDP-4-dehydrorhamnose reductase [Eubacterium ruminantium]SJZ57530.1 dTDP-4-dehydrorhamnose reductase [Eubacterium ruminantium]